MNIEDRVKQASAAIQAADALLVTAGAGMGVDSGLPDFRGKQGFWQAYPAIAKLGRSFEQMAMGESSLPIRQQPQHFVNRLPRVVDHLRRCFIAERLIPTGAACP